MKWKKWLAGILLFLAGIATGWAIFVVWMPAQTSFSIQSLRLYNSNYKLINPLLDCQAGANAFTELLPFEDKVSSYIDQINDADPTVDFIAVYFRDLNNGPWFGVNANVDFTPASLLKVPVMIAFFKEAEADQSILQQKIVYHPSAEFPTVQQDIPPAETLQDGQTYTVENLIYRMIAYSDNLAQYTLLEHVDSSTLASVFNDFNLPLPNEAVSSSEMTVTQYAAFFRILFNGSYISQAYSEKALEFLADSQFQDGLVAGVPTGVTVAHKFGEREFSGQSEMQLHDCGIVYYPNHPYLLCVMSRGTNLTNMASRIADVSRFVYNEVDNQLKSNSQL